MEYEGCPCGNCQRLGNFKTFLGDSPSLKAIKEERDRYKKALESIAADRSSWINAGIARNALKDNAEQEDGP